MRDFNVRIKKVAKAYRAALDEIPAEPVVNRRYQFRLDTYLLRTLLARLDAIVAEILLEGGDENIWLFGRYVEVAATRGTAQVFANLSQQSAAYRGGRISLQEILRSEPHRRRMALLSARVSEEMKGVVGDVKSNMTRVLTEGIGRGLNPREVAKNLTAQAGIETRRAHRIARTEITTALRRAKWDEASDAEQDYGLQTKELHLSALSPTTRATHAARHGKLFTRDQVQDWWSQDGNSVNCKCTTVSVMVDDEGKPVVPSIIQRAQQAKTNMEKRGYAWSDTE
ncbi:phage minor head protein [Alcaligenes sp. RM2]